MNSIIRILLITLLSTSVSHAQVIKGRITNQAGEPIQYSTVYIQELKQGTTANIKGDYEIRLKPGKYTVIYQSLGYEPIITNLSVTDNTIVRNIILPVQYYSIPEVRITATGEDPAYIIMRKVIGMAPYYQNSISYYKAEVYLKGNLTINRIPKIIQKQMKIEARDRSGEVISSTTMKAGDVYLMESFNEMEFTAPDKYKQKVISFKSTFPDQGDNISPMDFIEASFYQPVIADIAVSPLSPQAFSYYKFKYLGATPQGNIVINKIQVIPKRKSQQVFEGTIYIIEDLWCLQSVDLTNENLAGKITVQQLYIPVQDEIWMSVSHKFQANIDIMGFKADAGYGGSVKYLDVKANLALQRPKTISTNYTGRTGTVPVTKDTAVSKNQSQINKILAKDEISNRDMVKLSRLMEKESVKSNPDSTRKNLEIKDNTTSTIEKDAAKKDSAYWAAIRPIPLSEAEMRSIRVSDSIRAGSTLKESKSDTTRNSSKKEKSKFVKTLRDISLGKTWYDSTGLRFSYGGLVNLKYLTFNTVDGFTYGMDFSLAKSWKNGNSFSIRPDIHWAFSREKLMWNVGMGYRFDRMKQRQVYLNTGVKSNDFVSSAGGINTLLNTATSLLFEKNYLKLYETSYITLGYMGEIINGMRVTLSAGYEDRKVLENTTDYSFINTSSEYTNNTPVNKYLEPGQNPLHAIRDMKHFSFMTTVAYTPFQRYRVRNGVKMSAGSDWPTFAFSWDHSFNEFSELTSPLRQTDKFMFEVSKRNDIGAFSEFRWRLKAGGYLDKSNVTFYDFFHFNSQAIPLLLNEYNDAFMIPAYYSMSTPELFGEAHVKYTTPYLLLKLLPGLSNTLMRENLSLSTMASRHKGAYTELGYSISEFLFLGEIGVYVGFDNLKYRSIGAKVVLKFD